MKVIDLLNKIANNEDVPKKIKYNDTTYTYHERIEKIYGFVDEQGTYLEEQYYITGVLNHEVEVLEEDKEIEERIEKLGEELNKHFQLMVEAKKYFFPEIHEDLLGKEDKEIEYKPIQELKNKRFTNNQKQIAGKINELIKAVNELKKGK